MYEQDFFLKYGRHFKSDYWLSTKVHVGNSQISGTYKSSLILEITNITDVFYWIFYTKRVPTTLLNLNTDIYTCTLRYLC